MPVIKSHGVIVITSKNDPRTVQTVKEWLDAAYLKSGHIIADWGDELVYRFEKEAGEHIMANDMISHLAGEAPHSLRGHKWTAWIQWTNLDDEGHLTSGSDTFAHEARDNQIKIIHGAYMEERLTVHNLASNDWIDDRDPMQVAAAEVIVAKYKSEN